MVICFSLTNLSRGGAQTFVLRLASALRKKGHEILIYDHQPDFRNTSHLDQLDSGIRIHSFAENRIKRRVIWKLNALLTPFGRDYQASVNKRKFKKLLHQKGVQVVNSHMSASDFVSAEAVPHQCIFIPTLHGEYELLRSNTELESFFLKKIQSVCSRANCIIYTADKNLQGLKGITIKPVLKKISIGFDPSKFTTIRYKRSDFGLDEKTFVVGMISRGIPEKGWDSAINIFKVCKKTANNIVLFLIGDGDYLAQLHLKANDPDIKLQQFENNYNDYFSCYSLFDVFLFPTRFRGESVPNVVIEALSQKVPVLATRHADIASMIEADTRHAAGFCIPEGDSMEREFADRLLELYKNPQIKKQLSANCTYAFQKFRMDVISDEYITVFKNASSIK